MENLFESLIALQARLRRAGISSAIIGGVAVSVWGEPRVTRDVDIKVLLTRKDAARLLNLLMPDYKSLIADPLQSLTSTGIIFVQDELDTRLDILLSDTSFDAKAIQRAQAVELEPGLMARICSAEDLIVYKLISTRLRDYQDAASVIRRQGDALDDDYVLDWLRQFEQALDDSTLIAEYRRMRGISRIE
ncbi:MAG: hypothetical protein DRI77_15835 [Chloroflexi bacterium]|nr:MAG: hypothetical protein DRI77_15835 [Chloroflexota bacterium]